MESNWIYKRIKNQNQLTSVIKGRRIEISMLIPHDVVWVATSQIEARRMLNIAKDNDMVLRASYYENESYVVWLTIEERYEPEDFDD